MSRFRVPSRRLLVVSIAAASLFLCTASKVVAAVAQPDSRTPENVPFLGLSVRDTGTPGEVIVGWVYPGPLQGTGFNSPNVDRGDMLRAVDGTRITNAAQFNDLIKALSPGARVEITVARTNGNTSTSVPTAGDGGSEQTFSVHLGSRAEWSGPISFTRPDAATLSADQILPLPDAPTVFESFVNTHLEQHDLVEPTNKLKDYFEETLRKNLGANMLNRVAFGFLAPTRLIELHESMTDPLAAGVMDPRSTLMQAAMNLDVSSPTIGDAFVWSPDPEKTLDDAGELVEGSRQFLRGMIEPLFNVRNRPDLYYGEDVVDLALEVSNNIYINNSAHPERLIRAMQEGADLDYAALFAAAEVMLRFGVELPASPAPGSKPVPLPNQLMGAIEGEVLAVRPLQNGWIVYGGTGDNSYDMTDILLVVDPGGNDTYRYTSPRPRFARPRMIVDAIGNDRYEASEAAVLGPACGFFGVDMITDHSGNDTYVGGAFSGGVGLMGIGMVVDRAGADTYEGTRWSLGAALYGFGGIIDLGTDNDVYTSHVMSQGVGGPRGFGLILEQGGRDLYRANGPVGSAYGTPAVYLGFSQGVGFGVRQYDSGGIGVIADLAGDDRYEAGEFSQGGAYYWGLGILYDRAGRDLYYANRYGQAYAAHQALGILVDDAGDDTYWSMTAASQAGTWDICAGILLDRAGNDSYQADGLAQGGASQQAMAWLIDLDGRDRYIARGGSVHGQSGGNNYHYLASECMSWSMLIDAGGGDDVYSSGRENNTSTALGDFNEKNPENSSLHGMFIDISEALDPWPR